MHEEGCVVTHTEEQNCFVPTREAVQVPSHDPVNHPSHYTSGGIEVIDAIEAWELGFHLGNTVKYVARAGKKDDVVQDLKKARWYLDREISNLEAQRGS